MNEAAKLTPGQQKRVDELIKLAEEEFGRDGLSDVERRVIRCAVLGEIADFSDLDPDYLYKLEVVFDAEAEAIHDGRPLPDRPIPPATLSAGFVRWIACGDSTKQHLLAQGIRISHACITGQIDLAYRSAVGPVVLVQCHIEQGINLYCCDCAYVDLRGSYVGEISAEAVDALDDKAHSIIGGGCKISGDVMLNDRFRSDGRIDLSGAHIGGNFECTGSLIFNPGKTAFMGDGLRVVGNFNLNTSSRVIGEVHVIGAELNGDLDLGGGWFSNLSSDALTFDRSKVGGDLFANDEMAVIGNARFVGMSVKGRLKCDGITIRDGVLDLSRTEIASLSDSYPFVERIKLSGFVYHSLVSDCPHDSPTRLGWLALHDQTVGADVPDPQPYRWLAEVMKKQGHEDEARTVLRRCAERRMGPLIVRAFRTGSLIPVNYASYWMVILSVVAIAFAIAGRMPVAVVLLVFVATLSLALYLFRELQHSFSQVFEFVRVLIAQLSYYVLVGHGYARWRAAGCALVVAVIGIFVFSRNPSENMQPAQAVALRASSDYERRPNADNEWVEKYPKFDPVIYSIDTLLPLVSFHQEDHWTPSGRGRWGKFVKNVYLPLHISAGWVIATLFVASFTRLMRQEG